MTLQGKKLAVSIPDTLLEEKESLREKTAKLGLVARACSVYGVDVIEVFRDPRRGGEGALIRRVLEYLETPQYLRRRLYPLDESLRYAGVLPPLRIPSHKGKVPMENLKVGEVREGVSNGGGTADIGLDVAARVDPGYPAGRRLTLKVESVRPLVAAPMERDRVREYWGYVVEEKGAAEVVNDPRFRVKVGTSRLGTPFPEAIDGLQAAVRGAASVKLVFGSPSRGLFEMLGKDLPGKVDFVLNLFPEQHVETVRTEEAISAGLGLLGFISSKKA